LINEIKLANELAAISLLYLEAILLSLASQCFIKLLSCINFISILIKNYVYPSKILYTVPEIQKMNESV